MPYITMPRRFGKTAHAIRRALEMGGPIAVNRESTRQRILESASLTGIRPPEIIIIEKKKGPAAPPPWPSSTTIFERSESQCPIK